MIEVEVEIEIGVNCEDFQLRVPLGGAHILKSRQI